MFTVVVTIYSGVDNYVRQRYKKGAIKGAYIRGILHCRQQRMYLFNIDCFCSHTVLINMSYFEGITSRSSTSKVRVDPPGIEPSGVPWSP